jgi:hypothetical protein
MAELGFWQWLKRLLQEGPGTPSPAELPDEEMSQAPVYPHLQAASGGHGYVATPGPFVAQPAAPVAPEAELAADPEPFLREQIVDTPDCAEVGWREVLADQETRKSHKRFVFELSSREGNPEAIRSCGFGTPVELLPDMQKPGCWMVLNAAGVPLGRLLARHAVARELAAGRKLLFAEVSNLLFPNASRTDFAVSIRAITGDQDDVWTPPVVEPRPLRSYSVGIVGESNYQAAIRRSRPFEPVLLFHELGNPFDPDAIVIRTSRGETIGYIARESWVQRVVHEDGEGCEAHIQSIAHGGGGTLGVVLELSVTAGPLPTRQYSKDV